MEKLSKSLSQEVGGRGLLQVIPACDGKRRNGTATGVGANTLERLAMVIHNDLEPWPELHVGAVDIGVCHRDFAALKLEGRMLIETNAHQYPKRVCGLFNQLLRQSLTQDKDLLENFHGVARDLMEGLCREEFGQERVLGTDIVHQCQVEVTEGNFDSMIILIFFGQIRRESLRISGSEDVNPSTQRERVMSDRASSAARKEMTCNVLV